MVAEKLKPGGTIGIVCPSHIARPERYAPVVKGIERCGYRVKLGANVYKETYGYSATPQERADDFNAMATDGEVGLVLFGGGTGGNELLPLLDYGAIAANPKLYASYSDGTSILNAIHAKTGLTVYYGTSPGEFEDLRHYDYTQFTAHFTTNGPDRLEPNSEWATLAPGRCEGTLMGGYTLNFALLQGGPYLADCTGKQTVLFLEDHEKYCSVAMVSAFISHIEQSPFMASVAGLLFGHYSTPRNPQLMALLERFGQRHRVPVVYCDDFGHGTSHAILPIGAPAALDAGAQTLRFL